MKFSRIYFLSLIHVWYFNTYIILLLETKLNDVTQLKITDINFSDNFILIGDDNQKKIQINDKEFFLHFQKFLNDH